MDAEELRAKVLADADKLFKKKESSESKKLEESSDSSDKSFLERALEHRLKVLESEEKEKDELRKKVLEKVNQNQISDFLKHLIK